MVVLGSKKMVKERGYKGLAHLEKVVPVTGGEKTGKRTVSKNETRVTDFE